MPIVFGTGKKHYPQLILEECKYAVKEEKMPKYIIEDIKFSSNESGKKILIKKIMMNKSLTKNILMRKIIIKKKKMTGYITEHLQNFSDKFDQK